MCNCNINLCLPMVLGQPSEGSFDPHRGHNPPAENCWFRTLSTAQETELQNPTPSITPSPTTFQMLSHLRLPSQAPPILFVFLIKCRFLLPCVPQPLCHTLQATSQPVSRHLQPSVPLAVACALSATCIPSGGVMLLSQPAPAGPSVRGHHAGC